MSAVIPKSAPRGTVVIDADALTREVTAPGSPALTEIAARFGADLISPAGELDRAALARHLHRAELGMNVFDEAWERLSERAGELRAAETGLPAASLRTRMQQIEAHREGLLDDAEGGLAAGQLLARQHPLGLQETVCHLEGHRGGLARPGEQRSGEPGGFSVAACRRVGREA